jgi:hypothetical protein
MRVTGINSDLIRPIVVMLFFVIALFLRASEMKKRAKAAKAARGTDDARGADDTGTRKETSLAMLREAMRQAAEQARMRRGEVSGQAEPRQGEALQMGESFQAPPTIEPESSIVPSLLLLALVGCLCLMAYRYWAG